MNEKKKERVQTIILLCLVFFAMNYSLYNFVIVPWKEDIQLKQVEQVQNMQNADYENSLNDRIVALQKEVDGLKKETVEYDVMVLNQIDTLNICYDFYQYFQDHNISGKTIQFSGIDDYVSNEGAPAVNDTVEPEQTIITESKVEEVSSDTVVPTTPPANIAPVIVETTTSEYYKVIGVNLSAVVKKSQYFDLLKNLESISKQKLYVSHVGITAVSDSANNLDDADEFLSIIVNYNAYVHIDAEENDQPITYSFYEEKEGIENMEDIFSSELETN